METDQTGYESNGVARREVCTSVHQRLRTNASGHNQAADQSRASHPVYKSGGVRRTLQPSSAAEPAWAAEC